RLMSLWCGLRMIFITCWIKHIPPINYVPLICCITWLFVVSISENHRIVCMPMDFLLWLVPRATLGGSCLPFRNESDQQEKFRKMFSVTKQGSNHWQKKLLICLEGNKPMRFRIS